MKVTDEMVDRFLSWNLPESFNPDGGIKFDGCKPGPVGTNLLTAIEARAMLEHVLAQEQPRLPMEQHEKIKGYRKLSDIEIGLMNEIKAKGAELEALLEKVGVHNTVQMSKASAEIVGGVEVARLHRAEPHRWRAVAKTHFQEGLMALNRAVAQPENFG